MRQLFAVLAITLVTFDPASSKSIKNVELEIGSLTTSGEYSTQVVSVTNKTGKEIKEVKVECAFYQQSKLLASARSFIENLDDGEMGSDEVVADKSEGATDTKCRIVDIQ